MKKRLFCIFTLTLVALMFTGSAVWAKSAAKGDGAYGPGDKEFYLDEQEIVFIRPGLVIEIMNVVIPDDRLAEVEFKLTDPGGLPLDRGGIFTPGPVSTSFILSVIPAGEEAYVAYTTRVQTSPITDESATQATSDSGGSYTDMGLGVYKYKFGTEAPDGYDMDATHTVGVYARRDLREFNLDRYVDNDLEHFIPSGTGTPEPRDIVTTDTCNRCHDPLAIHGGSRQEVGLCILCHNPTQSIDPDTLDSVDMPYMVHKIHYGQNLVNGYTIIGYRQSEHDYSEVVFPPSPSPGDPYDCEVCHTGGTPTDEFPMLANPATGVVCDGSGKSDVKVEWGDVGPMEIRIDSPTGQLFARYPGEGSQQTGKWVGEGQSFFLLDANDEELQEMKVNNSVLGCADNPPGTFRGTASVDHTVWMTRPSRMACGSCHDDIDFESGEGHAGGPQTSDDGCSLCHQPDSGEEYDASVNGAHQVFYRSAQLDGFYVDILSIEDTDPGDSPMVTFSMYDKFGPIMPAEINRMRFSIQGPNEDFSYRVEETANNRLAKDGDNWKYRFDAELPMLAMGSYTLGVEGRLDSVIDVGGEPDDDEDQMETFSVPFAVTDDSAVPRRQIVDDYKCENCHSRLSLHGDNRQNATDYCQTCHQPDATDADVRPEGTGEPQSIDFRYMVHKIHAGAELETGYTVYGYRSSFHDYSEVHYVGDLRNCEACHVNESYMLPLPATNLPVTTPRDFWSPMLPETASCLSCHDSAAAASHADSNTGDFGESCSVCHGEGSTYSVERVHAR